jgi:hypothetical protein
VTAGEVSGLLKNALDIHAGKIARIMIRDLPAAALEAWNKIGGLTMVPVYRIMGPPPLLRPGAERVVKRTLADGTAKVYRYAKYDPRLAKRHS